MKQELFNQYVDWVSDICRVPKKKIFSRRRTQNVVEARHLLFYLCHERGIPLVSIRNYMVDAGLDIQHPSILHGIKKIKSKVQQDEDYAVLADRIKKGVTI